MTERLAWVKAAPGAYEAMSGLERYAKANLDPLLFELVKLRASYLNGCAFCVDMHAYDALKGGEQLQRILLVAVWREAEHLYTAKERAALALTEEVTTLSGNGGRGVSDEVWAAAAAEFDDTELTNLLTAIATINAWNRFAVSTRMAIPTRTA
ncbi:carboxymuconolactone decarboxylase family protein [Actinospica durhamensis]|uniref:Carboxymuconolactone decarboxylase family protein n=1 Tax=Actinospica durhamensis TaxID=1508375 RepID=A0A941ESQ0_9ACTN|nr:carboxymuconolactone decarboxylase family protein [Actinospica durhamensis]MBR7837362.1 carboxymuconolactone decarboxylase family protein [Actinospica durhamensis]